MTQSFSFTNLEIVSSSEPAIGLGKKENVREENEKEREGREREGEETDLNRVSSGSFINSTHSSSNLIEHEQEQEQQQQQQQDEKEQHQQNIKKKNINNINNEINNRRPMSVSSSSSSAATTSSPILEAYLSDLKKVIEWLAASESVLLNQSEIGNDVNLVKQQFQTHEVFIIFISFHLLYAKI